MSAIPHLVGMVHLLPLPGSPSFGGSMSDVLDRAKTDSYALVEAGFPSLIVENLGDAPYFADRVPPETVASMSLAASAVAEVTGVPLGINVLRNDALSSIGIAAAANAQFVRVNVLTGLMNTDQGPVVGGAAEAMRKRAAIAPSVEVWADVMVKHSTPPSGFDLRQSAIDTVERGLADAVIVTGSGTGSSPDLDQARQVRDVIPKSTRLVIGSGANTSNLGKLSELADSVIVGSSSKVDGHASNPVDRGRAAAIVQAARDCGLL